jgi:acetolactate synthase-1/2/3 large subunit
MEFLRFAVPGRRFLAPRAYGALGWGLPAAIGAQFAAPGARVVCLTGDGGFGYVFQELETAARYALPLVVIVLNNRGLGFQRHYEQQFWANEGETRFLDVDFAAIARAMGCDGVTVDTFEAFAPAFDSAITSDRPIVVDVKTDLDARPPLMMFDA